MTASKWLKMDLHIHSSESNITKGEGDYEGGKYKAKDLFLQLRKEQINLFSITDHNILNLDLYEELLEQKELFLKNNMNFVVGVELDIKDEKIYSEPFHALLFFNSYDLKKIKKIIREIIPEENGIYRETNLSNIFEVMHNYDERDFILIPHYNSKSKGLREKKGFGTIKSLNSMVFDAFEDRNNIEKIQDSLEIYLKAGYDDLPMLMFSDCHNINVYPRQKENTTKIPEFLSVLGSLRNPFETLKLAFQDSKLRIGFDKPKKNRVYRLATNYTQEKNKNYGIEKIRINDDFLTFSEYQNTIIGGFGSGKSFLLYLLRYGIETLMKEKKKEYGDLLNEIKDFKIYMSDGSERDSLQETGNESKIIVFEQNEDLFYKNVIEEEDRKKLEEQLNIDFPKLKPSESININTIIELVEEYERMQKKQITNNFNYGSLANRNFYRVSNDHINKRENDRIKDREIQTQEIIKSLKNEINKKIFKEEVYTSEERQKIQEIIDLINVKNEKWVTNLNQYDIFIEAVTKKIVCFNKRESDNEKEIDSNLSIHESINQHIRELSTVLYGLKRESNSIEVNLSKDKYESLKNKSAKKVYDEFELIAKYDNQSEYKSYKDSILKFDYRDFTLFQGIVKTIRDESEFHNHVTFRSNINSYYENIFKKNFSDFQYDIVKNDQSIMDKSAGEKANMILELIFSIINKHVNQGDRIILLVDQPEDHLDNRNIDTNIVNKIIDMKTKNTLPQFIFVTHNANVAITADSENIIIANKENNICTYKNAGIENKEFIDDVCKILEGGVDALKRRGMKFSVSYVKEY